MANNSKEDFLPFITSEVKLKEFTLRAVILGIILTALFGAANAYLGLKIGMTVSASIPAAVISMAVLRTFFKNSTILENNLVQTFASSGESLIAGVIFVIPALFFLNMSPSFFKIFLIALSGGLLGIAVMIPLRFFLMVKEHKALPFPEGTACYEVLKAGEKKAKQAKLVFAGIGIGAIFQFIRGGLGLFSGAFKVTISRLYNVSFGLELSPLMLGVGFLIGPMIAYIMLGGALLRGIIVTPVLNYVYGSSVSPDEIGLMVRMIGAGGVAMGGLLSIIKAFPMIIRSFKSAMSGMGFGSQRSEQRINQDFSLRIIIGVMVFSLLASLFTLPAFKVNQISIGYGIYPVSIILIFLFSFFFVAVSARMVGLIGTTSQPVSGMTISALLATAFILKILGISGTFGMACALAIGAVICIAICLSGDISQDLKTGALLGATPRIQQAGEMLATLIAAVVAGFILLLFKKSGELETLPAPQAHLMADIVKAVMTGEVMWKFIGMGAAIALIVFIFKISPLAFAIGLYLPITTSSALIVGGIIRKIMDKKGESGKGSIEKGTLLASGMIAGEALLGVILAGFAFFNLNIGIFSSALGSITDPSLSLILYGIIVYYFLRRSR
jgi:putative OPT family oligopeptide transporter